MKILVTGATGFVGSKLAMELAQKGRQVHVYSRSQPDEELVNNTSIKVFRGDILNREVLRKAMEGCSQVYHPAAYARSWAKDSRTYYKTNVEGTVNVMECAMKLKVEKVVFTSTAGIFGPSTDNPTDENQIRLRSFHTDYMLSKYMAEEKVKDYALRGLDAVIVNPTRVYGPGPLGQSNSVALLILYSMKRNWDFIPGNGKIIANYVYIKDIVDGHIKAMEKGRSGERYILGGENASYIDFFNTVNNNLKKKNRLFRIPFRLIDWYASLDLMATEFGLKKAPAITPEWVKLIRHDANRSSHKAIRELGYQITPLDTGVQKTIEWLNQINR